MAKGINKAIIIGNLGQDPETQYAASGSAITNISVATSESWKDKQTGERVEKTEWHRVVFFNRLAEIAGEYLRKGSKVYIEGRIQTDKYEKDGQTRYSTKIVANEMQMLDSREGGQQQQRPAQQQGFRDNGSAQSGQQQRAQQQPPAQQADAFTDDDIPF